MGEPRVAAELVRPGVGGAQPHQRHHRVSRTIRAGPNRAGPNRASPNRAGPNRASPNRASPSTWNGAQSGVGGTSEGWDGADGWNGDQELLDLDDYILSIDCNQFGINRWMIAILMGGLIWLCAGGFHLSYVPWCTSSCKWHGVESISHHFVILTFPSICWSEMVWIYILDSWWL